MSSVESKTTHSSRGTELPWIEKYRPQTLDDVSHQEATVKALRRTLEQGNMPHLLFYGPPGTGKTSTILAVARELWGDDPQLLRSRVLELNASDERGIGVVRSKVKDFASVKVKRTHSKKSGFNASFKIIILDEADSLTRDAQGALRRTMELHADSTRFCLLCNYVSKIIDPITSRCAKFRFKPLPTNDVKQRLCYIINQERDGNTGKGDDGCILSHPRVLQRLVDECGGDLRKAINLLQSTRRILPAELLAMGLEDGGGSSKGVRPLEQRVNAVLEVINDVSGVVPDSVIEHLWDTCTKASFGDKRTSTGDVLNACDEVKRNAYALDAILRKLLKLVSSRDDVSDTVKAITAIHIGRVETALLNGADEELQLKSLMCGIVKTLKSTSS